MNSRRTFRLRTPRIKTKVHAGGAMLPWRSTWQYFRHAAYFQNFIKVLKILISMVRETFLGFPHPFTRKGMQHP